MTECGARAGVRTPRMKLPVLLLAVLLLAPSVAVARDYAIGELRIGHPYARPTPPGARTAGVYFTVANAGKDADRLVRVASPVARAADVHTMTMDGNVMRMRAIAALDIPAGKSVALAPGGYHVMLLDLGHPLAPGDSVPLTLTFEKAGTIRVEAQVEAPQGGATHGH